MRFIKKLNVEDTFDIAKFMYDKIMHGYNDVMFVGLYEDATEVIKELLCYDETKVFNIEIEPEDSDGYDMEYYVYIDEDFNIWCSKAYYFEKNIYLYTEAKCVLIADDCNHEILNHIGSDEFYEVSYLVEENDTDYNFDYKPEDPCDGNCCGCGLDCRPDLDENPVGNDTKNVKESNHESSTVTSRVAVDENGKIKGFEKTWSSQSGNMTYHSTYSHYGTDQEMIKKLMENFDIKI